MTTDLQGSLERRTRQHARRVEVGWWLLLLVAFLTGTIARCYMILDQVPLDDVWHGLEMAADRPLSYLATHSGLGATSIPLNMYCRLLLETVGWSELGLRLPSLAAGLAGLLLLPLLVRRALGNRVALTFAFLLAISPFLVFYSRVCRPYSVYLLASFLGAWACYFWVARRNRFAAGVYIVSSVVAIYFFVLGVVVVLAPLAFVMLAKLKDRFTRSASRLPNWIELAVVGALIGGLAGALLLPDLLQSETPNPGFVIGRGKLSVGTLYGFAAMMAGTPNAALTWLFVLLTIVGAILLCTAMPLIGGMFMSIVVVNLGVVFVLNPKGSEVAIVFTRFAIIVLPIAFLCVARALDRLCVWLPSMSPPRLRRLSGHLGTLLAVAMLAALLLAGPLPRIYAGPNNFTNHSAFQQAYEPLDWARYYTPAMFPQYPYRLTAENISPAYTRIAREPDATAIVEYPMMVGDHFNPHFYFQHFHKKRVIVGYCSDFILPFVKSVGFVYGNHLACEILSRVREPGQLRFRNMINIMDTEALRASPAKYVLVHKNLETEVERNESQGGPLRPVMIVAEMLTKSLGRPIFEDEHVILFPIRRAGRMF